MKKISAAVVCVLLLLANVIKYWPDNVEHTSSASSVAEGGLPVEKTFAFRGGYQIGTVDLFATSVEKVVPNGRVQSEQGSAGGETGTDPDIDASAERSSTASRETPRRQAQKTGLELLSVAEIAGVKKGLVKYGGKHYFVLPGDVIDGKFVVLKIDEKRVYLRSVAGSDSP